MSYKIPTYKAKSGWVALVKQKHFVSLFANGERHITEFKAKYLAIKTGTGCINFKVSDLMPEAEIKKVIEHAIEYPK